MTAPATPIHEIMIRATGNRISVVADPFGPERFIETHTDIGGVLRAVARALTGTPEAAPSEREIAGLLPYGCTRGGNVCEAHRTRADVDERHAARREEN